MGVRGWDWGLEIEVSRLKSPLVNLRSPLDCYLLVHKRPEQLLALLVQLVTVGDVIQVACDVPDRQPTAGQQGGT